MVLRRHPLIRCLSRPDNFFFKFGSLLVGFFFLLFFVFSPPPFFFLFLFFYNFYAAKSQYLSHYSRNIKFLFCLCCSFPSLWVVVVHPQLACSSGGIQWDWGTVGVCACACVCLCVCVCVFVFCVGEIFFSFFFSLQNLQKSVI